MENNEGKRIRLSRNTSRSEGMYESIKPVDAGMVAHLEHEVCNATDGHGEPTHLLWVCSSYISGKFESINYGVKKV